MNTHTIARRLNRCTLTKRFFLGVFACDQLPAIHSYPCSFVLNLDPATQDGSHWVGVFALSPHRLNYFDSYGMKPNECVRRTLRQFSRITHNTRTFQSLSSSTCGYFAMAFIALSSLGVSFEKIIQLFGDSKHVENYVKNLVNKLLK